MKIPLKPEAMEQIVKICVRAKLRELEAKKAEEQEKEKELATVADS